MRIQLIKKIIDAFMIPIALLCVIAYFVIDQKAGLGGIALCLTYSILSDVDRKGRTQKDIFMVVLKIIMLACLTTLLIGRFVG